MRIGIVSKWIASGQAVVARQIRSALDEMGHRTFVLARPGSGPRAQAGAAIESGDPVWKQPELTAASAHKISADEYLRWARVNKLEAILFDENYQFAEVERLRAEGIRTIGRFVWEYFGAEHAAPASKAYETIYSLTLAEQARYRGLGIESPYLRWGIHPELLGIETARSGEGPIRFYFPGSFLGKRKPVRKVIRAFAAVEDPDLRLLISAQVDDRGEQLRRAADRDPRISLELADLPEAEHRAMVAGCDVCIAPTRWEGLGLPLFEAIAFGMPIITNDKPPMCELVDDQMSGILVGSHPNGTTRSLLTAWDPDPDELAAAISQLADPDELARLRAGTAALRERRTWSNTISDLRRLVERDAD